jgi:hypothetical protein
MNHWIEIKTKFDSFCACGKPILKGQDVLFYSTRNNRYCLCIDCSHVQRNAIRAESSYEKYGTDCAYDI